eukprot:m.10032 g.10032  ORF g.10032 m.10032 type:complete len:91 (+) comp5518_c0_seq1:171-443(+)
MDVRADAFQTPTRQVSQTGPSAKRPSLTESPATANLSYDRCVRFLCPSLCMLHTLTPHLFVAERLMSAQMLSRRPLKTAWTFNMPHRKKQ